MAHQARALHLANIFQQMAINAEAAGMPHFQFDVIANHLFHISTLQHVSPQNIQFINEAAAMLQYQPRRITKSKTGGSTGTRIPVEVVRRNMVYNLQHLENGYEQLVRQFPLTAPLAHIMRQRIQTMYELANRRNITHDILREFTSIFDDSETKLNEALRRNQALRDQEHLGALPPTPQGTGKPRGRPRKHKVGGADKHPFMKPNPLYSSMPREEEDEEEHVYEVMRNINSPPAPVARASVPELNPKPRLRAMTQTQHKKKVKEDAAALARELGAVSLEAKPPVDRSTKPKGTGKPRGRPRKNKQVGGMGVGELLGSLGSHLVKSIIDKGVRKLVGGADSDNEELHNIFTRVSTIAPRAPIVRKRAAESPKSGVKKYHIVGKGVTGGAKGKKDKEPKYVKEDKAYLKHQEKHADTHYFQKPGQPYNYLNSGKNKGKTSDEFKSAMAELAKEKRLKKYHEDKYNKAMRELTRGASPEPAPVAPPAPINAFEQLMPHLKYKRK